MYNENKTHAAFIDRSVRIKAESIRNCSLLHLVAILVHRKQLEIIDEIRHEAQRWKIIIVGLKIAKLDGMHKTLQIAKVYAVCKV